MQDSVSTKDVAVDRKHPPATAPGARLEMPERTTRNPENPYLAARREWDERYGALITRAKNWRLMALLCAAIALVETPGLVALALRGKEIIVIPVDLQGHPLGSNGADRTSAPNDNMRRTTLADWVSDLRMVTVDGVAQREAINRVYAKIANGSPAQVFIGDFYRNDPPQSRALRFTVHVEVNSVLPTSDKTYVVEWLETTRDLQGQSQSQQRWKGAFMTVVNPPDDEGVARLNPLGLYVTHASWSKVL